MVKSFIAFYLIQYHKNAFHDKLFLSVFFHFTNGVLFPWFGDISKRNLSLGLLIQCYQEHVWATASAYYKAQIFDYIE